MVKIQSELGNSNVNTQQPRHFTVSDESEGGVSASQGHTMQDSRQQPPRNQGPMVFNATEPVAPPRGSFPQQPQEPQYHQANQPQYTQQAPTQQPMQHGSYEEAMAYRQQYMQQMREQERNEVKDTRSHIEVLLGIGRKTVDVPVESEMGSTTFTLKTLKSRERKQVAAAMDDFISRSTHENLHKVRDITLCFAIAGIEGRSFDSILGTTNMQEKDAFAIKYSFVSELEDNISSYLYGKFEQLDADSRSKYSLKTEKDVKEVAEAISKSG